MHLYVCSEQKVCAPWVVCHENSFTVCVHKVHLLIAVHAKNVTTQYFKTQRLHVVMCSFFGHALAQFKCGQT